jgi:uncharacterized protein (DUF58 family)
MKSLQEVFELEQFDNLEWVSHHIIEGFITGLHKSPYHGFSVEFAEHRLYNTGESTKHIDWKLYARSDKLFVKKYEEETNLRCMIAIDTSSSMLFPFNNNSKINKLSFSAYSSAALIYLLRRQRDATGLTLFSDKIDFKSDIKISGLHNKLLYNKLEESTNNYKLNKKTNIADNLHLIADTTHKRSLIIIFSDFFSEDQEKLFSALEHLRYNKHEIILFHITDKNHEQELNYSNRPIKFIDMETGIEMKLNPNEIRDKYTSNMSASVHNLKTKCNQYNIDFIEADINSDFRDILIPFLAKRKRKF